MARLFLMSICCGSGTLAKSTHSCHISAIFTISKKLRYDHGAGQGRESSMSHLLNQTLESYPPEYCSQNTVLFRTKYCFSLIPFSSCFVSLK